MPDWLTGWFISMLYDIGVVIIYIRSKLYLNSEYNLLKSDVVIIKMSEDLKWWVKV